MSKEEWYEQYSSIINEYWNEIEKIKEKAQTEGIWKLGLDVNDYLYNDAKAKRDKKLAELYALYQKDEKR